MPGRFKSRNGFLISAALATALQFAASPSALAKFVKAQPIDGLWWLTDTAGKPFISRGVDNVSFYPDFIQDTKNCPYAKASLAKYKTQGAWRQATAARLLAVNFNTLGAWSDEKLAQEDVKKKQHLFYTLILHAVDGFDDGRQSGLPDFFDPKFEESVKQTAQKICAPHKDDENLIGYFGDNELPWVNLNNPLLVQYLNRASDAPGRKFAHSFLRHHYSSFAEFNRIWTTPFDSWNDFEASTAKLTASRIDRDKQEKFEKDCAMFAGFASSRYFAVIDDAIRAADPNHLNLGCRFVEYPGTEILRSCVAHVDVISFNCYELKPEKIIAKYEMGGKPLLIGEFAFRAVDSGLPNKKGGGPIVSTQSLRADYFASYVKAALKSPYIIGYHWFEHSDQPKEGRFDGENSNYGIVDINDEPYMDLTEKMKEVNLQAQQLHAKSEQM